MRFVFHNVPGAEAPAEMTFSIPDKKAYGGAENMAQTMHNLLPVRGAKVRDALRWASYMEEALEQTRDAEVYFGQHNWPIWGHERIAEFITKQRDLYKYTHDQTVRLINAGYTPREIADKIKLPKSLESYFGIRGYYGDLRHNVKAVYQFYLGAYDGNPANLDPLPPQESAKRYLDLIGGAGQGGHRGSSGIRQGRLPMGGRIAEPCRVRPTRPSGRQGTAGPHLRSNGLHGRSRHLAKQLPDGRIGTAQRSAEEGHRSLGFHRHAVADADRALP